MSKCLIRTVELTKKFGSFKAVDRVNLKVPEGGIYGFLGPNGAGKSTTIRMLLGLIRPTAGEAFLFNQSIKNHRLAILKQVGSMVESPSYYGHLTAYENLKIISEIRNADKGEIDKVLKIVDLSDVRNKKVKNFSMGMKQRLGIAQALIGKPRLLILDEPTNGLDPSGIHQIRELIKSLPGKMGITILVSSHILSEIELMATHLGIIKKGKLVFQGTLDELRRKSQSGIKIVVEPKESALRFLKEKGCKYEVKDGYTVIKDNNLNPASINKDLIWAGFDVYHLSKVQSTLEDIFLDITTEGAKK